MPEILSNPAETLKPHPVSDRPYQKVGADIYMFVKGKTT